MAWCRCPSSSVSYPGWAGGSATADYRNKTAHDLFPNSGFSEDSFGAWVGLSTGHDSFCRRGIHMPLLGYGTTIHFGSSTLELSP